MEEKNTNNSGFLLVDKDENWTSHDAVAKLRRITKIKKIGHAGTLDPFATGLLIMAVGRGATKQISEFIKKDKVYEAELIFGAETDTHDREGKIVKKYDCAEISEERIKEVLKKYIGEQEQIPPMHSAKKINGKKLYELARKGEKIERKPSLVNIYDIEILNCEFPKLILKIHSSSGTYIRALARDIGRDLGCGAYLQNLRRTKIGNFNVKNAKKIKEITSDNWKSLAYRSSTPGVPGVELL